MSTPNLLWAQRADYVWITVDVTDAQDIQLDLKTDKIHFSCSSSDRKYEFDLNFFKSVVVEESKYLKHRLVDICLKKAEEDEWPRLTAENKKFSWIKVDWSKWEDSDDEKEAAPFDMSNMGGFGDFGLPSGFNDFQEGDSDDEDELPELPELPAESADKVPAEGEKLIEEVNQAS
jgi:prostaglandin-E synthase